MYLCTLPNACTMIKILDIKQVGLADQYTIQNEPILSIALMERAAQGCCDWIFSKLAKEQKLVVFAGPGNNGGDGLAIARIISNKGYRVQVIAPSFGKGRSKDCQTNLDALKDTEVELFEIGKEDRIPAWKANDIVIDALFGSGLTRPIDGVGALCVDAINQSQSVVVSIDIPSGLFADKANDYAHDSIIRADYTLSLQMLKHSFLFAESESFIGEIAILPIGLHPTFIEHSPAVAHMLTASSIQQIIHPRAKHAHKGNFGHALLISGQLGMMGACILSAKACLRSGVGLLTTQIPSHAVSILQNAVPEAMLSIDSASDHFSEFPKDLQKYSAIAIGPGLGQHPDTAKAFKFLIQESHLPLILDADALNILAENPTFLAFLPQNSILTPHIGEFDRLVGKSDNSFEREFKLLEFARRNRVYVVLKGAYTAIAGPQGELFYNTTGNSGMATGGSGDVLTGMILSFMAQGYHPLEACQVAVFVHGLAGDLALENQSVESLLSSDLIEYMGKAFKMIKTPQLGL